MFLTAPSTMPLLSRIEIRKRGLELLHISTRSENQEELQFHKHYGSSSLVLAEMWYDMCHGEVLVPELTTKETHRGLKMFFAANFFLWTYPKNSSLLASRFGLCEKYARGKHLWVWIKRIDMLSKKVIKWDPRLDARDASFFAISIDGVDKQTRERKHPTLPYDTKNMSHKHHHGGSKWQIVLSVHSAKCVDIYGPCRGGMGDKEMLARSGVLRKLKHNKVAIVDRGYIDKKKSVKLSWPNPHDAKEVNNFKSRARLRHESFNGRMSFFDSLSQEFRHTEEQHGIVFKAVATIVQYQMNNGSPLFEV